MKRLLTMALVIAIMATMFVVTPIANAEEVKMMSITPIPNPDGIDEFKAEFNGTEDATWVVWTVYASNNTDDEADDEIIYADQKRGIKAASEGFSFKFNSTDETDLKAKGPFVAEAKIYFADSSKNKTETEEYVYLTFAESQKYIRELFDETDGESVTDAAKKLGLSLPKCFVDDSDFDSKIIKCLYENENYADRKYKETYENPDAKFSAEKVYADIKTATFLTAINSENATSIENLIKLDSEEVGIDNETLVKFNASVNKADITIELAKVTYGKPDDFVKHFKALVFLDELSVQQQTDIIDFIKNAITDGSGNPVFSTYGDQEKLEIPEPFVLNFEDFDKYIRGEGNEDNLAKAQLAFVETKFDSLDDLATKFNELLKEFKGESDDSESDDFDEEPEYTPSSGGGGSVSYAPPQPIVGDELPKFDDIDNVAWAHEAINTLASEGVIVGVTNTQFQPNASVTREQFVQIIVKTFGLKGTGKVASFTDADQNAWYAESLNIATELGIVSGVGADAFGIGATITRQDMATIMYRVANYLGINLVIKANRILDDEASISGYAVDAVKTLYKAGIINGVSDGIFAGSQIATRAQAAKLCYDLREAK